MTPKIYLLIFCSVFFFFVVVVRTYLLKKNTGLLPVNPKGRSNSEAFNETMFKIIGGITFFTLGIYVFGGGKYQYLLPFWYLEKWEIEMVGWILLHSSLIWVVIAQLQMSNSWRIGIDAENKTALVTHGLFTISRNPIFFGLIIAGIGFFLVFPNAFNLLTTSLSITIVHSQVRLEEDFLKNTHGKDYEDYQKKVRRWI